MGVNHVPSLIVSDSRKRAPRMPSIFNNLGALIAFDLPNLQAKMAAAKVSCFLKVVTSYSDMLSQQVFSTVAATNASSLCLVQECKQLEDISIGDNLQHSNN